MTRPKKGDDKRDFILRVRLNAAEKTQLLSSAKEAGLTPSDFVRLRSLGSKPLIKKATPDREVLIKGFAGVNKLGSNVNQIARALNRRQEAGEFVDVSMDVIKHALEQVTALAAHLDDVLQHGHTG